MPGSDVVRAYDGRDRAAVRRICFETGYMGDPPDWFWRDAESWADMFCGYYTDCEPGSAFVIETDGVVTGYLLGAIDASKAWNPATVAARHIVRRGIALRPGTARCIWRTVIDGAVDIARRRVDLRELEFSDPRYPAHLHIDLLPVARGRGLARRLVQEWFARLREASITGCHLQTVAENTRAIAFFEANGFRRHGAAQLIPGWRSPTGARHHMQAMVCDLPG